MKTCSVLQGTFKMRLGDDGEDSASQSNEAVSVRVLGSGLGTPTTYLLSHSLPRS